MRKECSNIDENLKDCTCTYPCEKKGKCCDCISYHRKYGEIPGCFFPANIERTYDRTIQKFVSLHK